MISRLLDYFRSAEKHQGEVRLQWTYHSAVATMNLTLSPTYHYSSPLARSRSELRGATSIRRTSSYSGSFTMPQYGYGGGFMSRSLSRSSSSLFGRSLSSSALTRTPPLHSVALQRSTPHYSDRYPYVRYSYGNTDTSLGLLAQSESLGRDKYSVRDLGTKRWLEGRLNTYNTRLFMTPNYEARVERPIAPVRNYIRYMPVDDAVDMYKKRCMTVGTLSKYWLSSSTLNYRRDREFNYGSTSSSSSRGNYLYGSRYSSYPTYSRVASRLYTRY